MKNPIQLCLAVSFIFFCITVNAQDDKSTKGGIRFGYNQSAYFEDGDMLSGTGAMQSFFIGAYKESRIIPLLHFSSGLEYSQNGIKDDDDNKLVLHYINVPLHLKAKIGPVFALTGFAPSFKVAEKQFIAGEKSTPDEKSNWFDVPFYVGAGVKILFITVDARYHWGILEVDDGIKSQYFQLGAGIVF